MNLLIVAALAAMMIAVPAFADSSLQSGTTVGQTATGTSAAIIQPGAVAITSTGANSVRTVGNAPSQSFQGSLSPDLCLGSASVGGGWLGGALSIGGTHKDVACIKLRTFERLQQAAASEPDDKIKRALRDASYDDIGAIDDDTWRILRKHGIVKDDDASGTVGHQPDNYLVR